MIKISIVSYSNTIPFLYGLNKSYFNNEINVSLDDPSTCAKKLISNKVDIGLIPVVSIKMIKDPKIISNYCIGADGSVDTVCVYSEIPINEVKNIFIDSDSETSVKLLMILLKEYWKVQPNLIRIKIKNEVLLQKKSTGLSKYFLLKPFGKSNSGSFSTKFLLSSPATAITTLEPSFRASPE